MQILESVLRLSVVTRFRRILFFSCLIVWLVLLRSDRFRRRFVAHNFLDRCICCQWRICNQRPAKFNHRGRSRGSNWYPGPGDGCIMLCVV